VTYPGLEAGAAALTVDHEVVGVADEAVDRGLGAHGIGEGGEPLIGTAVAGDDDGTGAVTLGEELVYVATLLGVHGVEP